MSLVLLPFFLACAGPISGNLPEGIYGSPDLGLRVDATGGAVFERSCGRGDLGVVSVTDGAFEGDFAWVVTGGAGPLDTGPNAGTPATVIADVTAQKITGSIESGGATEMISLSFGQEPTYFECP